MKIFFEFEKHQTNYPNEIVAGITTFVTIAYIMIQNPATSSEAGIIGNKREELNFG